MRKFLVPVLILSLIFGFTAKAASTVELVSTGENIIRVGGTAKEGAVVSVIVINPGFSENDVSANGAAAVQYYGKTKATNKTFSIDIKMRDTHDTGGGEYTLIVSTADSVEKSDFSFYFSEKKLDMIDKLNTEADIFALIDEAYTAYSLSGSQVYKTVSKKAIADVLSQASYFERDVDIMFQELLKAFCVAAFREGNAALVENGKIGYADTLGLAGTNIFEDYLNCLSDGGRGTVNEKIMGKNYKSVEDIAKEFKSLTLLYLMTDYVSMGYGHVPVYLEKYEDSYSDAGIDFGKLRDIKNKNKIYQALASSHAPTLVALSKDFKDALKSADSSQGSSDRGGSDSAGNGRVMSSGITQESGFVENNESPFADTKAVEWAEEAIAGLFKIGVVAGKTSVLFAPNDSVTRAEFTKMVVTAFFNASEGSECNFTDVTGWSVPFVAHAVEKNIVTGISDTRFDPDASITREQAASIVVRALTQKGYHSDGNDAAFSDDGQISGWAKNAIYALAGEGIISGRENNMFCPADSMTRAEAAKIIFYSLKLIRGAE